MIIINRPDTLYCIQASNISINGFEQNFHLLFFLCRILSCIQAGACNIRSYWQTHGSSVCGLVWMRRTYSGKVVTTWGHFVTRDKPSASCCRLPPQLVLSWFKKKNRLLPAAIEKTPLRLYSCFTHRQRENIILLNNSLFIITMHFFI